MDLLNHTAPSIEAVERVGTLEARERLAAEADVQEAPEELAHAFEVDLRHPAIGVRLVLQELRSDLLHVHLLRVVQNREEVRALGDPVAPDLPLPDLAMLLAVEAKARGGRHLVIEDLGEIRLAEVREDLVGRRLFPSRCR